MGTGRGPETAAEPGGRPAGRKQILWPQAPGCSCSPRLRFSQPCVPCVLALERAVDTHDGGGTLGGEAGGPLSGVPGACGREARKLEEEVRAGGVRTCPVGSGQEGRKGQPRR